ncbi:MAG: deoxyuridine 5'-triphosphate nucleotidohydrolase [Lachnospiraceae bacterium]|nr:deoxyuridine 5'-triphosphate nucleotidohydrolase [Lachnospiraceae bacterium]
MVTAKIYVRYIDDAIPRIKRIDDGDWLDLYTAETVSMKKGDFKMINLGVAMELPDGCEAHLLPRSSTYKNFGIIQANSMGIVDHTFCGNGNIWHFPAIAMRDTEIPKHSRIAQFRIMPTQFASAEVVISEVDDLGNKDRGDSGSTGTGAL